MTDLSTPTTRLSLRHTPTAAPRRSYRAVYAVEFFERKTQPSYALWAVKLRQPGARTYPKLPTGYGRCATLEQAHLELTAYCEAQGLTFQDLRLDLIPWRLVKDLLEGKNGAEYFARAIKRKPTAATAATELVRELVFDDGNKVWTDSLKVAERFGKRHDNVVQAINNLPNDEFRRLNFKETFRNVPGPNGAIRKEPYFEMTWQGFSLLAMGFTGSAAYEWKIKFLDAFETMGALINRRQNDAWKEARANGIGVRKTLTESIQRLGDLANQQSGETKDRKYYPTITRMIYQQLFGDGELKQIRNRLEGIHVTFLQIIEEACGQEITRLTDLGVDYHDIYAEAKQRVIASVVSLSATKITSPAGAVTRLSWEMK